MTEPLHKPPRKDPQARTVSPTTPPAARSRSAHVFTANAAEGRLTLQQCETCGAWSYPARDACGECLSTDLVWKDVLPTGRLIAETTIRTSTNTYFRERTPWRIGSVQLECGPTVMAHVHGDAEASGPVRLIARTDRAGQGTLFALPEEDTCNMADDRQLRQLTCDPRHRRVLVTDGRSELGQAMARTLSEAGADQVFVGIAEDWRPFDGEAGLRGLDSVTCMPLDLTDTTSVQELAAEIGGKADILVNTAEHVRPGGVLDRRDVTSARDEMEIACFGLLRLMQSFGPAMSARGADGENSAAAWVNIFSVFALCNMPGFGLTNASQAAGLSLAQSLRAELRGSGVKVVNGFIGPLEEDWRQPLPP
ncbi:MAG: SDR family NAD(P)-dependent oxidoreductase, partial [Pseudomonadota bacterium]